MGARGPVRDKTALLLQERFVPPAIPLPSPAQARSQTPSCTYRRRHSKGTSALSDLVLHTYRCTLNATQTVARRFALGASAVRTISAAPFQSMPVKSLGISPPQSAIF